MFTLATYDGSTSGGVETADQTENKGYETSLLLWGLGSCISAGVEPHHGLTSDLEESHIR